MTQVGRVAGGAQIPASSYRNSDGVSIVGQGNAASPLRMSSQQVFNPVINTIFVRPTGNDVTGNGSAAAPYATLVNAVLAVPAVIPAGQVFNIDVTGTNETLPQDFTLPCWKAAYSLDEFTPADPYRVFNAAVNIIATPQLVALSPTTDAIINAGDVASQTADPTSGLITLTLSVARTSWGTNNLRGRMCVDANGGVDTARITSNSTTVLHVTATAALTFPIQIMQEGATFRGTTEANTDPAGGTRGMLRAVNIDSIAFSGLDIANSVSGKFGLGVGGNGTMTIQNCKIDSPDIQCVSSVPARFPGNWITGGPTIRVEGGNILFFKCLLDQLTKPSAGQMLTGGGMVELAQCFVDRCITLQMTTGQPVSPTGDNVAPCFWLMTNNVIYGTPANANSTGDGLSVTGGTAIIANTVIINCARDGIRQSRLRSTMLLDNVGSVLAASPIGLTAGAIPAGWGLNVFDGSSASANAATYGNASPLVGTLGAIQIGFSAAGIGTPLSAATWAAWSGAGKNLFDIQSTEASGATGSGGQVYGV